MTSRLADDLFRSAPPTLLAWTSACMHVLLKKPTIITHTWVRESHSPHPNFSHPQVQRQCGGNHNIAHIRGYGPPNFEGRLGVHRTWRQLGWLHHKLAPPRNRRHVGVKWNIIWAGLSKLLLCWLCFFPFVGGRGPSRTSRTTSLADIQSVLGVYALGCRLGWTSDHQFGKRIDCVVKMCTNASRCD